MTLHISEPRSAHYMLLIPCRTNTRMFGRQWNFRRGLFQMSRSAEGRAEHDEFAAALSSEHFLSTPVLFLHKAEFTGRIHSHKCMIPTEEIPRSIPTLIFDSCVRLQWGSHCRWLGSHVTFALGRWWRRPTNSWAHHGSTAASITNSALCWLLVL